MSLNPITKVLASVIIRRLTPLRWTNTHEQQAGFGPSREFIDQILTLRQVLELAQALSHPRSIKDRSSSAGEEPSTQLTAKL
ncbi:unnamed protein product [Echinostoma caproni]|uniref:Reverse transcriptase domain-containing protein n=1 Tax=Echinostoma caproni TaxID=27848 RepID=A0A183AYS4_9TREM|nr:unnamed protein product [Echinostoma caproni]